MPADEGRAPPWPKQPAPQPTRRDFLYVATAVVGAVGAAATLVPLIDQMEPDRATIAAGAPIDVDIGKVAPGQQIQVFWRSKPIFIINRTPAILKSPAGAATGGPTARPEFRGAAAAALCQELAPLGQAGICRAGRHLHPSRLHPDVLPNPNPATPAADWQGGYFCPCHGSKYDLAGRVFKGVPAPYNLPVPPYHFVNDKTLRIGENPPNVNFDFGSIVQL